MRAKGGARRAGRGGAAARRADPHALGQRPVMTPEAEGPVRRYRATGAFNLSFFLSALSNEDGS